jgi:hypothetical protein
MGKYPAPGRARADGKHRAIVSATDLRRPKGRTYVMGE